uniref:Uncharacterized protein n=1 Tax=Trichuris muris TaxID=70415 RepID=A0A5S6R454_TRIMR
MPQGPIAGESNIRSDDHHRPSDADPPNASRPRRRCDPSLNRESLRLRISAIGRPASERPNFQFSPLQCVYSKRPSAEGDFAAALLLFALYTNNRPVETGFRHRESPCPRDSRRQSDWLRLELVLEHVEREREIDRDS